MRRSTTSYDIVNTSHIHLGIQDISTRGSDIIFSCKQRDLLLLHCSSDILITLPDFPNTFSDQESIGVVSYDQSGNLFPLTYEELIALFPTPIDICETIVNDPLCIQEICNAIISDTTCITEISNTILNDQQFLISLCDFITTDTQCITQLRDVILSPEYICNIVTTNCIQQIEDALFPSGFTDAVCTSALTCASEIVSAGINIQDICNAIISDTTCITEISNTILNNPDTIEFICTTVTSEPCISDLTAAILNSSSFIPSICSGIISDTTCIQQIEDALFPSGFTNAVCTSILDSSCLSALESSIEFQDMICTIVTTECIEEVCTTLLSDPTCRESIVSLVQSAVITECISFDDPDATNIPIFDNVNDGYTCVVKRDNLLGATVTLAILRTTVNRSYTLHVMLVCRDTNGTYSVNAYFLIQNTNNTVSLQSFGRDENRQSGNNANFNAVISGTDILLNATDQTPSIPYNWTLWINVVQTS